MLDSRGCVIGEPFGSLHCAQYSIGPNGSHSASVRFGSARKQVLTMKQWMLLLCFSVLHSTAEATSLKTSDSPVKGMLSEEVSLPCSISPISDATPLNISWLKKPNDLLVYSYHLGSSRAGSSFEGGRANIDLSKLTRGDLTLTLLNLTFADEGTYLCQTTDSKREKVEKTVELEVWSVGQRPLILLSSLPTALSISLSCQSSGWAPAPQVSWIGGDGSLLGRGESEAMGQGKPIKVINKVTINAKDEQKVSCSLRNTLLDKEMRETVIITGDFPPSVSPWLIVFIVLLLILGVIAGVVFWQYSKKREAIRVKERQAAEAEREPLLEQYEKEKKNAKEEYDKLKSELSKARVVNKSEWARVTKNTTAPGMKEGFSSGNPYWEVAVREKDWIVGVIEDGMDIKTAVGGKDGSSACPEKGVCALSMKGSSELRALLSSPFPITPSEPPRKLGFLLDWEEKQLSVYDAERKQRLYTFNTEFKNKAVPFCL
ncbi:butyrophilin subfamily 3 member A2-like [Acipenser ruthenus]|uniref:butyrophilin subfamily 3 member A2-like n=1 Tax=Acipenser ruthenus TaxID=7906 RepID=UPI0027413DB2|nr:butyrophilin subfamily 3 member A2-like [Acipenser ruthenus]